jgi:hypothetical protein
MLLAGRAFRERHALPFAKELLRGHVRVPLSGPLFHDPIAGEPGCQSGEGAGELGGTKFFAGRADFYRHAPDAADFFQLQCQYGLTAVLSAESRTPPFCDANGLPRRKVVPCQALRPPGAQK